MSTGGMLPDAGDDISGGSGGMCQPDPTTRAPCEFLDLSDPTTWTVDPDTGLRYRRVTLMEQESNGWLPSEYLVESSPLVDAVEEGAKQVPPLLVPVADGQAVVVGLDGRSYEQGPAQIAVAQAGVSTVRPTLVHYLSKGEQFPQTLVNISATVGALRGIVGSGTVGGYDVRVTSYGPAWDLEDIAGAPAPSTLTRVTLRALTGEQQEAHDSCVLGSCEDLCLAWEPAACGKQLPGEEDPCFYEGTNPCANDEPTFDPGECDDGADNDGDGTTDYDGWGGATTPDSSCQHQAGCTAPGSQYANEHVHRFESGEVMLVTGNLDWCARQGDWYTAAWKWMDEASSMLGNDTGNPDYDKLAGNPERILRWAGVQCWVLPPEEIVPCERFGVCGPFGPEGAHPYPFAGLDLANFSPYLDAAWPAVAHATDAGLKQPVTLSAVFVHKIQENVTGKARFPGTPTAGALALEANRMNTFASALVHEMGHTLGLEHDETDAIMRSNSNTDSPSARWRPANAGDVAAAVRSLAIPRSYTFGK